jgi:hypothetical protein
MSNDEIVESNKGIQKNITQTSSLFFNLFNSHKNIRFSEDMFLKKNSVTNT